MTVFLLLVTIPIGTIWFNAGQIITFLTPDKDSETAKLAGTYLRVILFGAPGYACFEAGKRFVQAQGVFRATFYVLLICAPLNAIMSWMFVWVILGIPQQSFSTAEQISRDLVGVSSVPLLLLP
jgi:MATE family multidrug resistance protein